MNARDAERIRTSRPKAAGVDQTTVRWRLEEFNSVVVGVHYQALEYGCRGISRIIGGSVRMLENDERALPPRGNRFRIAGTGMSSI